MGGALPASWGQRSAEADGAAEQPRGSLAAATSRGPEAGNSTRQGGRGPSKKRPSAFSQSNPIKANQTQSKTLLFPLRRASHQPGQGSERSAGGGGGSVGENGGARACLARARAATRRHRAPPYLGLYLHTLRARLSFAALGPPAPTVRAPPPRRHSRSRVIRLPSACLARCGALRRSGGGEI